MYTKLVVSGSVVEVYEYEKLNVLSKGVTEINGCCSEEQRDENYRNTQRKRRSTIRQLICENFDVQYSKFITLTFDNNRDFDIKDVKQCNKAYKLFILRLKYLYPGLQYVTVIEFQDLNDRGAVHYHMICNLPYIKKSVLAQIWGCGHIKINAIDKVDNLGAYVTKYMNKDMDDKRLQGLKAYNCSKGLKRPLEVKSWAKSDDEIDLLRGIIETLKEKSPVYCNEYTSEYAGKVVYKQFNFKRKP